MNQLYTYFPLLVFTCRGGVTGIWTMTMWVLSYCRFDPDNNSFSLNLCMSLKYTLRKVVDSIELCACLNGASLDINSTFIMIAPIIMTPSTIMNLTTVMTHEIWFRLSMDITFVWSFILFTI